MNRFRYATAQQLLLFCLFFVTFFTSCGDNPNNSEEGNSSEQSSLSSEMEGSSGEGASSEENSSAVETSSSGAGVVDTRTSEELTEYIFDDDTVRTYEILISEENLARIDADPAAEEYVEGSFIVEGDTIGPVGIRYKGNEGAWWGCLSGGQSGYRTCPKLNMKVKINWDGRDTAFYGLKKFQLHAMNSYSSQLRERVGYWFFREMGVEAPRTAHVRLKINGEPAGLFLHVEQIDGRFLKHHFADGSGNLYKEVWPTYMEQAMAEQYILEALKTNEEIADISRFVSFGEDVEAADSVTITDVMERWLDMDQILRMSAVSYSLDDDDGPFHWYSTGSGGFVPHNFYWADEPTLDKFIMIPWDVDHMLERVANPDIYNAVELIDGWGETSNDCEGFGHGWPQRSASCDKLVAGWNTYNSEYETILQELLDGPFAEVETMVQKWEAQVGPVVEEMHEANTEFISMYNWEQGMTDLRNNLAAARSNVEAILNPDDASR
jgi:spore coat protein CotH